MSDCCFGGGGGGEAKPALGTRHTNMNISATVTHRTAPTAAKSRILIVGVTSTGTAT